jgi:phage terminase large subunit-like protein
MTNAPTIAGRTLQYWRAHPIEFIENILFDPESGAPFVLLPAERDFLEHAFKTGPDGRLLYPELVYSAPKKSGKTTLAAIIAITMTLLYGGRGSSEAIFAANDYEQSRTRCFEQVRKIIEASPLLVNEANITQSKITLGQASFYAIPADFASAAGAINQVIAVFDELWAFSSERARRLFEELIWVPNKQISCRLTVSYAGFSNEGELLEQLYARGMALPEVAPNLHAGSNLLVAWHHDPVAPWQTEAWLKEAERSLRPNQFQRMIRNEFVAAESSFIDMQWLNDCTDPLLARKVADKSLVCWAGVDASVKHDSTALALTTFDHASQKVVLCDHRIFQPSPEQPIDFASAIEATILDWHSRFTLQACVFDPYQMASSAQTLLRHGVVMTEFPQTLPRLTKMSENLYTLLKGRNLLLYRDQEIHTAISRTIATEGSRGWKLDKAKQSHKIDITVAIAMAALAAVEAQAEPAYLPMSQWLGDGVVVESNDRHAVLSLAGFCNGMVARQNYLALDPLQRQLLFGPRLMLNTRKVW